MITIGDSCKFNIDSYKLKCTAWRRCNSGDKLFEVTVKELKHGKWVQIYHTLSGPMIDTYFTADKFIAELIGE